MFLMITLSAVFMMWIVCRDAATSDLVSRIERLGGEVRPETQSWFDLLIHGFRAEAVEIPCSWRDSGFDVEELNRFPGFAVRKIPNCQTAEGFAAYTGISSTTGSTETFTPITTRPSTLRRTIR
jgi:hypothetical protein